MFNREKAKAISEFWRMCFLREEGEFTVWLRGSDERTEKFKGNNKSRPESLWQELTETLKDYAEGEYIFHLIFNDGEKEYTLAYSVTDEEPELKSYSVQFATKGEQNENV